MRVAIFSDVHGNLPALEAVLADIAAQKPDLVYCLGDLVGYGASPGEVTERIRSERSLRSWATTTTGSDSNVTSVAARTGILSIGNSGTGRLPLFDLTLPLDQVRKATARWTSAARSRRCGVRSPFCGG
jgi:3',5'-cyclic AMP phosphodiesterase CpdA